MKYLQKMGFYQDEYNLLIKAFSKAEMLVIESRHSWCPHPLMTTEVINRVIQE